MKTIILAAGYATRLYPLTSYIPKTLLPIAGKPILDYTLEKITQCKEIDHIYIITNDRFVNQFQRWHSDFIRHKSSFSTPTVEILNDQTRSNADRLGSIGDMWFAIESKQLNDDLLVICSDKLFEFSLNDFLAFFKRKGTTVNLCFDTGDIEQIRNKHGCVIINEKERIAEFQEKPKNPGSTIQSIAFYIFTREVIPLIKQYLTEGNNKDAPGFLLQWLCRRVPVYAFLFKEECYDIGTTESYREVDRIYSKKLQ